MPFTSLNAPYGARCFLTLCAQFNPGDSITGLNAPYGARCFLTSKSWPWALRVCKVLMHLMALGAF